MQSRTFHYRTVHKHQENVSSLRYRQHLESCTLSQSLFAFLQGTTAERLSQDGTEQFPPGHGLQTRGLAGQSHNKYEFCIVIRAAANDYVFKRLIY